MPTSTSTSTNSTAITAAFSRGNADAFRFFHDDKSDTPLETFQARALIDFGATVRNQDDAHELLEDYQRGFRSGLADQGAGTHDDLKPEAVTPTPKEPLHKPFSWLSDAAKSDTSAQFVALTRDVAAGLQIVLQLVHDSNLARESGEDSPMLDKPDTSNLLRMAIASAELMTLQADDQLEFVNFAAGQAAKGGKK